MSICKRLSRLSKIFGKLSNLKVFNLFEWKGVWYISLKVLESLKGLVYLLEGFGKFMCLEEQNPLSSI